MLSNKCPLSVVEIEIEVGDGDPHMPIHLVVSFHMPMNPNRAHVVSASLQWSIAFCMWAC